MLMQVIMTAIRLCIGQLRLEKEINELGGGEIDMQFQELEIGDIFLAKAGNNRTYR